MAYPKYWTPDRLSLLQSLYQSGLSMREVGLRFGKSIWAINSAMERNHIIRRLASETHLIQYAHSPLSFTQLSALTHEDELIKVAGLMLYWGEGGKKNSKSIDFANSDSQMILIFLRFLRKIYRPLESRFRVYLYTYQTENIPLQIAYWSNLTQIPTNQFTKPYVRPTSNLKHDKMPHGLVHIRYHDKRLFMALMSDLNKVINRWDGRVDKYTSL